MVKPAEDLRWVIILLALLLAGLFINFQYLELSAEEPRRATVALEMLESGDYLVPHLYGIPYFNKPPLFNWLIAGLMKLSGSVSEWCVRLPGLLSYLLTGLLLFFFVRKRINVKTGLWASLFYLFSADLLFYASIYSGEIDLFFSLLIFLNAIGIYRLTEYNNEWSAWIYVYLVLSLAVLTKGGIALHFHAFTLLAWFIYKRSIESLISIKHLIGIALLFLILFLYYFAYSRHGDIESLMLNKFIEASSKVTDGENGLITTVLLRWIKFPLSFVKIALPYSLLLFLLIKSKYRSTLRQYPLAVFSLIFVVVNIWPYWILIELHDRYLHPLLPFISIMGAVLFIGNKEFYAHKKWVVVLFFLMAIARITYDLVGMPRMQHGSWSDSYIYRAEMGKISRITGGKPVDLLYAPLVFPLPDFVKSRDGISRQPLIPYQVPYYLRKETGACPKLTAKVKEGNYYLLDETRMAEYPYLDSLYSFTERWHATRLVLVQAKSVN